MLTKVSFNRLSKHLGLNTMFLYRAASDCDLSVGRRGRGITRELDFKDSLALAVVSEVRKINSGRSISVDGSNIGWPKFFKLMRYGINKYKESFEDLTFVIHYGNNGISNFRGEFNSKNTGMTESVLTGTTTFLPVKNLYDSVIQLFNQAEIKRGRKKSASVK